MNLIKTHEFDFEGKRYEVRVWSDIDSIEIQTFLQGVPANDYLYSVRFGTRLGMMNNLGIDAVQDLIKQAERDVRTKMWERYLKAVSAKTTTAGRHQNA